MVLLALESLFQLLSIAGISSLTTRTFLPHAAGLAVSMLMLAGTALIRTILKRLAIVERNKENIEQRFQMLFNTSSDQLFVLSPEGMIVEVNQSACERLESNRNELLNKHFADIKSGPLVDGVMDHINTIRNYGVHIFETELKSSKGKVFPIEINCRQIEIDDQPFISCVARNITGRKELDKKVRIAIIETEETERRRFAKEIHDGLGPLLSTIKLYVNELETLENEPHEKEDFIAYINQLIDEAVDSARNIANNITPKILSDYGLKRAIETFCEAINATSLLKISARFQGFDRKIASTLELILYRIITELINNTIKHANAATIEIDLQQSENKLTLVYKDDGAGFDLEQAIEKDDNHMGVKNIISRVRSLNGVFNFKNTNPGILIHISVVTQSGENMKAING